MDEIIPGLWVGDLPSAKDTEALKTNNIFSILSAMRGRVTINEVQRLLSPANGADGAADLHPPPDSPG
jgi:dual specificity phosphatase 12